MALAERRPCFQGALRQRSRPSGSVLQALFLGRNAHTWLFSNTAQLYPDFHSRIHIFLPVKVLSRVFRGKFLAGLKRLYQRKQLCCAGPALMLANAK